MHKHRNFIARLLNRGTAADKECPDVTPPEQIIVIIGEDADAGTTGSGKAFGSHEAEGPTLCKGGKLYRARLRNGRWETFGPPIGDC